MDHGAFHGDFATAAVAGGHRFHDDFAAAAAIGGWFARVGYDWLAGRSAHGRSHFAGWLTSGHAARGGVLAMRVASNAIEQPTGRCGAYAHRDDG
jgi:hypothetical protein